MRGLLLVGCALLVAQSVARADSGTTDAGVRDAAPPLDAQQLPDAQPPPPPPPPQPSAAELEAQRLKAASIAEAELGQRVMADERRELAKAEAKLNGFSHAINVEHRQIDAIKKKVESDDLPPLRAMPLSRRDELFRMVVNQLDDVLHDAIDAAEQQFKAVRNPPKIPKTLSKAARSLPSAFQPQVAELEKKREELAAQAERRISFAADMDRQRAKVLLARALQLNRMRLRLLSWISDKERNHMAGFNSDHVDALHSELLLLRLEFTYWAHKRLTQLGTLPAKASSLTTAGAFAWKLLEVLFLLLLLRWVFGNWDRWMQLVIAAMGRGVHLGGWTLTFARFAELARSFGPAGLVMLASVAIYTRLGGTNAPAEVQLAYVIVFWISLLRMQLRFVQAGAENWGTRLIERERQRREIELVESIDPDQTGDDAIAAAPASTEPAHPEPKTAAWELVGRTWKIVTRYATVFIVADAAIYLAVGAGMAYAAVARLAWWGAIPLVIILLRLWQDNIVASYRKRSTGSALCRFTERHAHRVYGPAVVLVALVMLIGLRIVSFVRLHLSNLDSTKRVLAFLFRRRVEKHARERGHVLIDPHELPKVILDQFPTSPLGKKQRPVRPPLLDEIKAQFERWTETKGKGSIALVGASGMGKTTVLRMLQEELDTEVMHGSVLTKVTGEAQMVGTVARALGIDGELTTVKEIVAAIQDEQRLVIALDDCHNLFLRKIGGFEAWEAFTQVVNESCDNVFWVCSFNEAAWEYLNDVSDRVSYFRSVLVMPPWTDDEIRRLILTRMRRSRYRPNFTDLLVSRVEGVNLSTQIIGTAHGYFRLLWDVTNGNPRLANYFWLRSIVPDEEKKRVRVHLFASPNMTELEALSDNIAFVLAAIVEHENVTADELATICNLPPEFCRFALRYLREGGYLKRDRATGRTYLSFYWQQTVIRFLKRKHLLYS